jgi:DNA-binding NarL/FixJ family response regulator
MLPSPRVYDAATQRKAMEAGYIAYLLKSFPVGALIDAIAKAVRSGSDLNPSANLYQRARRNASHHAQLLHQ